MRLYPHSFSPISFHFAQSPRDFIVQEIPLYEWSDQGEHLILQIRKKGLSTQEMIKILCQVIGCKTKEVGYAGLKDKNALTTQYISLPYSLYAKVIASQDTLASKNIKILSFARHHNKIRIGHLKGNAFFIRLKKVMPHDLCKLESIMQKISIEGIPNYFGFQRFGKFGDNFLEGKQIIDGSKKIRDRQLSEFLISSYQSHLFNQWLAHRIKLCKILQAFSPKDAHMALGDQFHLTISAQEIKLLAQQPHFFKIFQGDALHHYPYGKLFFAQDANMQDAQRFIQKDISPCGLLYGKKTTLPTDLALHLQMPFIDPKIGAIGSYRFAWVFPQKLKYHYIPQKAHLELSFELPKGSYATILLEALCNHEIKGGDDV
ncbi:tRNA pseudouridine(13) synthase TruD [Helicobacter pametensis]|uniref:tRNA pseudouridine(13) synthase TruD n=1 Tax=Helicobacter pametensis TaxID=95149 RepID=UPI0004801674|nr:tRNA pseudouridine(13) synthase TruD [Helicobacter pametensis]